MAFFKIKTFLKLFYFLISRPDIGHTEASAGVASVIKTILCFQHSIVPKLHLFEKLHPNIDNLDKIPAIIPTSNIPWKTGPGNLFCFFVLRLFFAFFSGLDIFVFRWSTFCWNQCIWLQRDKCTCNFDGATKNRKYSFRTSK